MPSENLKTKKKSRFSTGIQSRKMGKRDYMFVLGMTIIPMIQIIIMYVGVNVNSLLLPFQQFDLESRRYAFLGFGDLFKHFGEFINDLSTDILMQTAAKNSVKLYFWSFLVGMPLSVLFAYCMYKKFMFAEFFKVMLYIPHIISGIVFVIIFKYMAEYGLPVILNNPQMPSIITSPETGFNVLMAFSLWLSFGNGLVLYLGAMNRIPYELIEYGQLEGISALKEFISIVVPMVFQTISVFIITSFVGLFTAQGALFAFFGYQAPYNMYTFGYYFFVMVVGNNATSASYPYAAAASLLFTVLLLPITLGVRYLLEKYGPNVEY